MIILAVILTWSLHAVYIHYSTMGRALYVAKKALQYDKIYARPERMIPEFIVCLIASAVFVTVYELLAYVTGKVVRALNGSDMKDKTASP